MVLKGRLELIYNMIPACDVLSDIGTDHALIPAYALMNGRCKRAIACDVRKGPLERAERTLRQFSLEDRMELRLGSGLEPLKEKELDCVVMAGMGGVLVTELIQDSLEKARTANHIILQPMVGQELVRPFLWRNGFEVEDEGLVREGYKLYQAIMIRYTGIVRDSWNRLHEVIGERLIEKGEPLLIDWVRDRTRRQKKIVNGLKGSRTLPESLNVEQDLLSRLTELLKILEVKNI